MLEWLTRWLAVEWQVSYFNRYESIAHDVVKAVTRKGALKAAQSQRQRRFPLGTNLNVEVVRLVR